MSWTLALELAAGCAVFSALATGGVLFWLRRHQVLDIPNDRSSHVTPTPRGGGLAVIPAALIAWTVIIVLGMAPYATFASLVAAGGLAYVGWQDDRRDVAVSVRLLAQIIAVAVGLPVLPGAGHIFQGLFPAWLDIGLTALIWLWFVNLFNFMDGIDGITGAETIAIGVGVAAVAVATADYETGALPLGVSLASIAVGFLVWNWSPARLFLGDVGSVPLGFLAGWLLLGLAGRGHWAPALILPLYYLVDATATLLFRIVRGRVPWQSHREHVYQRAVQNGFGHGAVVRRILLADFGLVAVALLAVFSPWAGLIVAVIVVLALIYFLLAGPKEVLPASP